MIADYQLNNLDDANLDLVADDSSIRLLAAAKAPDISFSNLIRGSSGFGAELADRGLNTVPSPQNRSPGTAKYLPGTYSYTTNTYSPLIDTVQIEVHYSYRSDSTVRQAYAEKFAAAAVEFYDEMGYGKSNLGAFD